MRFNLSQFPYPQIRDLQKRVLEKVAQNWETKKYFILQCGTGVGKSAIAKTIANWSSSAYIVTETKQLMDQYVHDFNTYDMADIKGRSNYDCAKYARFDCSNAPCNFMSSKRAHSISCYGDCPYLVQRGKAQNAHTALTSYAYMFKIGEIIAKNAKDNSVPGSWTPREVMVFDEAHSLEDRIVAYSQFYISPKELNEKASLFDYCDKEEYRWLTSKFTENGYEANKDKIKRIRELIEEKKNELEKSFEDLDNVPLEDAESDSKELMKKLDMIRSLSSHLTAFVKTFKDDDNWLVNVDAEGDLVFTPLDIDDLFKLQCDTWASKFVFMSATILDTAGFIKELGVDPDLCLVIEEDSPFDPKKSPIFYMPCGSMTYKELDGTLPAVYDAVRLVLKSKPDSKGIIHTGTYKIAKAIYDNVKTSRFVMKTSDKVSNQNILNIHARSKNTVILSPSMTTGVDLKDDLSRWQIIVKMPFGSLSDERVKAKSKKDFGWYVCNALRTIVQASGRSTRSDEDSSVTYVLDESFKRWVKQYSRWLPKSFLDRIVGF